MTYLIDALGRESSKLRSTQDFYSQTLTQRFGVLLDRRQTYIFGVILDSRNRRPLSSRKRHLESFRRSRVLV